ncbi:MAG: sulfide/dihydroorotate dehydrogenase-like FAD/NAD-binding protein, partial [Candidatus Omnitrophica bacterium]|nr:sulfide/dihydroorotate dehydrogenase-like FAD/NAD-binding protein [Candidatus Omnitrophota bacterium]
MKILKKEVLAKTQDTKITKMEIRSPDIARKARAGQFVVVMVSEEGERIPLTIVDNDTNSGTITLILQELGLTTRLLGKLNTGDSLYALVGPLGHATELKNYGKVILIGGGVGIAEIYPVAKALSASLAKGGQGGSASGGKNEGNNVTTILGARTKHLLILENELKNKSDELFITTDDGSYGRKGFTTDVLKELLARDASLRAPKEREAISNERIASAPSAPRNDIVIYAVGPIPMMEKVSRMSKDFDIKTIVSLNALMVDGTGMCGSCRVTVGGEVKFSCIDGPEFDGHLVDWRELTKRSTIYSEKENHI